MERTVVLCNPCGFTFRRIEAPRRYVNLFVCAPCLCGGSNDVGIEFDFVVTLGLGISSGGFCRICLLPLRVSLRWSKILVEQPACW